MDIFQQQTRQTKTKDPVVIHLQALQFSSDGEVHFMVHAYSSAAMTDDSRQTVTLL